MTASMLSYDFSTAGNKTVVIKYTDEENNPYTFNYAVTVNRLSGVISITDESIEATYGDVITILGTGSTNTPVITSNDTDIDIVKVNSDNTLTIVGVGETSVTISVAQTDKYEAAEVTIPVIASAKPVTLSWVEDTLVLTYNGKEQAPEASVEGILVGDTCNVTVSGAKKDVDTGYVATAIIDNANYVISGDATTKFDIVPKVIEIVWSDTKLVYNAEEQAPTAEVAEGELFEGDTCTVFVTGRESDAGKEYKAHASLSNGNYVISGDLSDKEYEIAPKSIELVWGTTEFVYNGEVQAPTVAIKDGELCGEDKCTVTVNGKVDAGKYTAEAVLSNNSYVIADGFAKKDYTIARKPVSFTLEIGELICGTEVKSIYQTPVATEGQRLRAASAGPVFAEDGSLTFLQDWQNAKLTCSEKLMSVFFIADETLEDTSMPTFEGTIKGGEKYVTFFSLNLKSNYTIDEKGIVVKYAGRTLTVAEMLIDDVESLDGECVLIKSTNNGEVSSFVIYCDLLAEHVAGELEKDENSVVEPTFEADGSYDMVIKCTKCHEVLSRETYPIAKKIAEVESITFSGFEDAKKDYLVGDDLDVTGLKYTVKMTDGTSTTQDVTKEMVSGFTSEVENTALVLSVSYSGKVATYTVSVKEPEGEYVVEGDTKFNGKDNMKLHIIHTNAKRNAALFSQFSGLDMDGNVVAVANYDATNGSIKLDIHSDYLKTLSEGEHTLTVEVGEDKVDVKITVTKVQEETTQPTQQQASTSDNAPSTGDTGSLVLWYVIALIALLSAAALAVARQKSRREEF